MVESQVSKKLDTKRGGKYAMALIGIHITLIAAALTGCRVLLRLQLAVRHLSTEKTQFVPLSTRTRSIVNR